MNVLVKLYGRWKDSLPDMEFCVKDKNLLVKDECSAHVALVVAEAMIAEKPIDVIISRIEIKFLEMNIK